MGEAGLGITADLSHAFDWVLGAAPTAAEPAVVVAACLDALAKGHGLSESLKIYDDPLQRADLPAPARALLQHLLADGGSEIDADTLRNRLYDIFSQLAQDLDARRQVNRRWPLTDRGLLTVGQVYWNLEANSDRPELPIRRNGDADIPVPGIVNKDFATMEWAPRCDQKCNGKSSSGQGFRTQGARLAVLAAQFLVEKTTRPLPDLEGAVLRHAPAGQGSPRILSIVWPRGELAATTPVVAPRGLAEGGEGIFLPGADRPGEAQQVGNGVARILVGAPAEVGADYQPRESDAQIERLWADGGDRRIWLRGGPGLGKSYSARRVMQEAIANQDADHDELLIWVDSADASSVAEALSSAADRLRQRGFAVPGGAQDYAERKARALLELLAVSTFRWLIVLDSADATSLIDAALIPPGENPRGRVLLTTLDQDHRVGSHGHVVTAQLFTVEEAEEYLRSGAHFAGRDAGTLSTATQAETSALAQTVGHHPLALSIAASTITANAMTVPDWIEEFTTAETMDTAADEPDLGGYPHLIGRTWQVALGRACEGLPEGAVERAALVAAIQGPDGHPTWLWDRDAVASWVAGGQTLARRHGMPVAVQRLIDAGVVELRGTWSGGQVAMHQLAARAVREAASAAELADIAEILLTQWLLELTGNPSAGRPGVLRRSLEPIRALPNLPDSARRTVTALLAYQQPTATGEVRNLAESLRPYLDRGGPTGRIEKARLQVEIAEREAALGRAAQAEAGYGRTAELYRQLVDDASLDDDELATCLKRLGDIEAHLGNPEQARASRERAVGLLERLVDTASDAATSASRLSDLVELHGLLGDREGKARALAGAEELVTSHLESLPRIAAPGATRSQGRTWRTLALLMSQAGRVETAKQCLVQEAALYERSPELWIRNLDEWAGSVQELALLHARDGEWSYAEDLLTRVIDFHQSPWAGSLQDRADDVERALRQQRRDALVLLASVQTHLGRLEEASQNLGHAAEQYRDPAREEDGPRDWGNLVSDRDLSDERKEALIEQQARLAERRQALSQRQVLVELVLESIKRGRPNDELGLQGGLLDLTKSNADAAPAEIETELELASQHLSMGLTCSECGDAEDALGHFAKAIDSLRLLAKLDSSRVDIQSELAMALHMQALAFTGPGRQQAAANSMTESVSAYRRAAEQAPDDGAVAKDLAEALGSLARMQEELGNLDEVVNYWQESIDAYSELIARQAAVDPQILEEVATAQERLGDALGRSGRPEDAICHYTEAVNSLCALADGAPDDVGAQKRYAFALVRLGAMHAELGHQDQAVDRLAGAANTLQLLHALDSAERPDLLITVLQVLEETLRDLGKTDEADETLTRASDLAEEYPDEDVHDEQ